uniref:Ig-like domain-containing protein n=1 Tax=Chrysemys picta bellii TaxID=8478 RepID=A0A8C3FD03_CHRPI
GRERGKEELSPEPSSQNSVQPPCIDPGGFPKPSISLRPSRWVTLGGAVTIRCPGRHQNMRFLLYKDGNPNVLEDTDPAGDVAEFPISPPRPNDGWTELRWGEVGAVSPLFKSCLLLKAGREFPKPTIWVSPSRVVALGGSVTIRCEGLYPGMKFFLRKAGHPNRQRPMVPDGTVAEFPIPSVGREDGGSYTCDYRSITDQSRGSYPSDPIEIIVGGEGGAWLSVPAPSPTPSQPHRGSRHQQPER